MKPSSRLRYSSRGSGSGKREARTTRKPGLGARRRPLSRSAGFTLLELMVAMIFVALLAAGIVITISTALNVWSKELQANEINQEARAIMELLTRDIRGAYLGRNPSANYFAGGVPVDEFGDLAPPNMSQTGTAVAQLPTATPEATPVDTLVMTTESSSAANVGLLPAEVRSTWDQTVQPPVTDAMQVRWEALPENTDQPAGLYRVRAITSTGEPEVDVDTGQQIGLVSQELISRAVESLHYQYYDGEQWLDSWDSRAQQNALPQAILVQLVLNDERLPDATPRKRSRDPLHAFETIVSTAAR